MFLKLPKMAIIFQNKCMNFFLLTNFSNFRGCFILYNFLISEMLSIAKALGLSQDCVRISSNSSAFSGRKKIFHIRNQKKNNRNYINFSVNNKCIFTLIILTYLVTGIVAAILSRSLYMGEKGCTFKYFSVSCGAHEDELT